MKHAWLGLLWMLFAIAFGITGAIWVGLHLGGWGLAVMVGVAMGTLIALPLLMWMIRRTSGGNPYGSSSGWGSYPGWTWGTSGMEGSLPGRGYGFPAGPGGIGFPGRERPGAPFGLPFPGMPWVSWIAWIPGLYPTPPDVSRGGWPPLPPVTPRTFTVIGEEEEE